MASVVDTIFNGHGQAERVQVMLHRKGRGKFYAENPADQTASFSYERRTGKEIRKILKLQEQELVSWTIRRQSLDARKKPELFFVYTIDAEVKNESRF